MPAEPTRLQLSRRPGFRLQAASRAVNGLPAVNVARPSRWGNPFTVAEHGRLGAVERYRAYLEGQLSEPSVAATLGELRGRNLACWCGPGTLCHADVLLEFAKRPRCEAAP